MRARKGWAAVFAALVMTAVQAANLSVTDVKIAQRYPWNGLVDITYTVNCDDPNKDVWVYPVGYDADTQTSVALMPEYLSGAGASNAVHNGTHQMTWNMAKQMGKGYNRAAFSVTLHAYCDAAPYMVIDLSAGSEAEKYEVTYLAKAKDEGWSDEYLTTKMVFRLIPPGTYLMQRTEKVTISKPFYCAVWPIMEQQYCLIMGGTPTNPRNFKQYLSYNALRGSVLGSKWPEHQQVDADSIAGKLRLRTGMTIDLPTSAQWEYAMRAGSDDATFKNPNAWGIRDACRVAEWVLDWGGNFSRANSIDPVGPKNDLTGYDVRTTRGLGGNGHVLYEDVYQVMSEIFRYGIGSAANKSYYFRPSLKEFEYTVSHDAYPYTTLHEGTVGARLVALPVCK